MARKRGKPQSKRQVRKARQAQTKEQVTHPIETWSVEMPFDSAEWLNRAAVRDPEPRT